MACLADYLWAAGDDGFQLVKGLLFPVADGRLEGLWLVNLGSSSKGGPPTGGVQGGLKVFELLPRPSLDLTSSGLLLVHEPNRGASCVGLVLTSWAKGYESSNPSEIATVFRTQGVGCNGGHAPTSLIDDTTGVISSMLVVSISAWSCLEFKCPVCVSSCLSSMDNMLSQCCTVKPLFSSALWVSSSKCLIITGSIKCSLLGPNFLTKAMFSSCNIGLSSALFIAVDFSTVYEWFSWMDCSAESACSSNGYLASLDDTSGSAWTWIPAQVDKDWSPSCSLDSHFSKELSISDTCDSMTVVNIWTEVAEDSANEKYSELDPFVEISSGGPMRLQSFSWWYVVDSFSFKIMWPKGSVDVDTEDSSATKQQATF